MPGGLREINALRKLHFRFGRSDLRSMRCEFELERPNMRSERFGVLIGLI